MSLEKENKKLFNDCMHCKNAVKKRMIGSKEWTIACETNSFGSSSLFDSDRRHFYSEDEVEQMIQNCCPYFTEKMVESWNEE